MSSTSIKVRFLIYDDTHPVAGELSTPDRKITPNYHPTHADLTPTPNTIKFYDYSST